MKKIFALFLALALTLALAACTAGDGDKTSDAGKDDKKITVAASSTPHALILEQVKPLLEKDGYTLEIKVMDDYVIPNTATESGDVDANYFQHTPYLDSFNQEQGTHLVSVVKVHYEPLGIYAGTAASFDALTDGAQIAVPNDTTNEARALLLLEANGLIKLKDGAGLTATKNDIAENPHNYQIVEMEAALVPGVRDEVALAVINGNYALGAGLKVSEALAIETSDSTAAQTYANILVVKDGNQDLPKIKALANALTDPSVAAYIAATFDGAVVAISK